MTGTHSGQPVQEDFYYQYQFILVSVFVLALVYSDIGIGIGIGMKFQYWYQYDSIFRYLLVSVLVWPFFQYWYGYGYQYRYSTPPWYQYLGGGFTRGQTQIHLRLFDYYVFPAVVLEIVFVLFLLLYFFCIGFSSDQ